MTDRAASAGAVAICVLGVLGIAALDYLAGPQLRLDPLYFGPVGYGTWRGGGRAGVALAALSAVFRVGVTISGSAQVAVPVVVLNGALQLVGCLAIAGLTARASRRLASEREQTRRDPLTGLYNPRGLRERLVLALGRAARAPHPIVVAYLDLDHFKHVNDRWGHPVGDAALRQVAEILTRNVRAGDTVARVGGDEFAVVLPGAEAPEAARVLRRLGTEIRAAMSAAGWPVTCSIGAVVLRQAGPTVDDLIAAADRALYRAKGRGRDTLELAELP